MAIRTSGSFVNAFQDISIMAKNSSAPCVLIEMAKLTLRRKSGSSMIRFLGFFVILIVTVKAGHSQHIEIMLSMTVNTIQCTVHTLQWIPRYRCVVPFVGGYIFPGIWCMTVAAIDSQSEAITIILAAFPVAGFAFGRSPFEYQVQVAIPTGSGAVFPDKREIGFVVGFHGPLIGNLLFLNDPVQLSKSPQNRNDNDHEQYFFVSHFRNKTLTKNRC
jgi:hypothetical protein